MWRAVVAGLWAAVMAALLGAWSILFVPVGIVAAWWIVRRRRHQAGARGPRLFPAAMRTAILQRHGNSCAYCGVEVHYGIDCPNAPRGCWDDYQADHVIAWDDGGATAYDNAAVACRWCNQRKGALSVDEFRAWMWSDLGQRAWAQRWSTPPTARR